jgi:RNA polymerase sigma factor (sigma-70 family)
MRRTPRTNASTSPTAKPSRPTFIDPFKDDAELLKGFREGHERALDQVYRAFVQPLRNFVLRGFAFKSGSRDLYFRGVWTEHDLDDIVQETFRRAFGFKARQSFDGVRPYKNYLFTIARNTVINDLSARNRQIPVGEALMRDTPSDDLGPLESWVLSQRAARALEMPGSSEEQVENLEVYGFVESFVEALSPDEQRFFRLRFLGLLSQEKTAKRMGWNRARVRKLEARLRRAFVQHIGGSGYLENKLNGIQRPRPSTSPLLNRAREIWRGGSAERSNEILQFDIASAV